jgi:hypothetical protein
VRIEALTRHAREAWEVPRDIALRRYPAFVTGGALPRGHIPVFCFHSLEPGSFGRKLEHLARNGYETLSAADYLAVLTGRREPPERAVVLTFDDGRSSVRTVGWPLMRRHGMKGIVFVVPGLVRSCPGRLPPTWDDVQAGQAKAQDVLSREDGPDPLMSWEELSHLVTGGLFDVESHTLSHAQVHVAPRIVDFVRPALRLGYAPLDVPVLRDGTRDLFATEAPLGAPLLRSLPRLGPAPRFYEDSALRSACVDAVAQEGADFFRGSGWERRLRTLARRVPVQGRFETPQEQLAAMREDLSGARRLIQERLGVPCEQLCYPWHATSPAAREIAIEAGYRAAYCGKIGRQPITLPGGDPLSIARVGEDYVELLPGRGRGSLTAVLALKWRRRLRWALSRGRQP